MKFVVDVNLSKLWVMALEGAGHEAHYWADLGRADDNDEVIMQWARVNSAHILTCDLDFSAILAASGAERPSVIQFRPGRHLPQRLMGKLMIALRMYEKALDNGALVTIDHRNSRVRVLPLSEDRLM